MTLDRLKATGRGRLHIRIVIEGLSVEFVTDRAMQQTLADGRVRCVGLDPKGIELGARADLRAARIEAQGFELKVNDVSARVPGSRHGIITRELWQRPSASTFLSAPAGPADTTLNVYDTSTFAASGVVHVGTEAISYTLKTATTLKVDTRAVWDTIAQRHFVADGEGLGDARVTNRPQGVEGRRVYLYLYGDGDSLQGDGHLRWRGVCSTDLKWDAGVWTVGVDPITRLLSQPLGSSSSDEIRVRGIHYDSAHPWVLLIEQPSTGLTAVASVVGFFETERDFCTAATSAIAAALTEAGISLGASGALTLTPAVGGYRITFAAHTSGAPHELVLSLSPPYIPTPGSFESTALGVGTSLEDALYRELNPANSESTTIDVRAQFPRGAVSFGRSHRRYAPPGLFGSDDWSWERIYLGAFALPGVGSAIALEVGDVEQAFTVVEVLTSDRAVRVSGLNPARFDASTVFTAGGALGTGTVIDLITSITTLSADNANAGSSPLLTSTDITWTPDVVSALESAPLCNGRTWVSFDQTTLADVLEPELIALGAYFRLSLTGQIEIDMLRPALSTDASAHTIDDSQHGKPTIERGGYGTLGLVRYRFNYDPKEDEWRNTISVRDVQNASATRAPIETTVEQRSLGIGGGITSTGEVFVGLPPTLETIMRLAVNQFAFFGTDYSVIHATVDPRFMDARIGDVVAYSSSLLPDTTDGTGAIQSRGVRIVGYGMDLTSGAVSLEMILHTEQFVGYHFGALIKTATLVSGFIYDIELEGDYSEGDATEHLYVGMGVVALEGDSATPTPVAGGVTSIVNFNTVRVTFVSAPSFTGDWVLRVNGALFFEDFDQGAKLAFVASPAGVIGLSSGFIPAKVFS